METSVNEVVESQKDLELLMIVKDNKIVIGIDNSPEEGDEYSISNAVMIIQSSTPQGRFGINTIISSVYIGELVNFEFDFIFELAKESEYYKHYMEYIDKLP